MVASQHPLAARQLVFAAESFSRPNSKPVKDAVLSLGSDALHPRYPGTCAYVCRLIMLGLVVI